MNQNYKNKIGIKDCVLSVYDKIQGSFFLSFIVPAIGLISNIFGIFDLQLKNISLFSFMYNENGLKLIPIIIIISILVISVAIILIKCIGDKFTSDSAKKEKEIYKDLLSMEVGIRKDIFDSTKDIIIEDEKYSNEFNLSKSPLSNRTSRLNSVYKLNLIVKRSVTFLARKFGCDENSVNMCIIYQKDPSSEWEILCKKNLTDNELNLKKLMESEDSTFNTVLQSPEKEEFIIDKNIAHSEGKYIKSQFEKDNQATGSIYCKNLSIYINGQRVKGFVLSIETTENAFCDEDDFCKNLCLKMFHTIESSIKNELINLCLMEYIGLGAI